MRKPLMLSLGVGAIISLGLASPGLCATNRAAVSHGQNISDIRTGLVQFGGSHPLLVVAFDDTKEDAKEAENEAKEDANEAKKGTEGSPKDIKEDKREADKDAREDKRESKRGVSPDE